MHDSCMTPFYPDDIAKKKKKKDSGLTLGSESTDLPFFFF